MLIYTSTLNHAKAYHIQLYKLCTYKPDDQRFRRTGGHRGGLQDTGGGFLEDWIGFAKT